MDITFRCDQCGQSIVIDAAGAGMAVQCPKCQDGLTVPQPPPTFRCKCGHHIAIDEAGTGIPIWCPKCHRSLPVRRQQANAAHNKAQVAQAKAEAGAARAEWLAKDGSMFGFGAGKGSADTLQILVEPDYVPLSESTQPDEEEDQTDRYIPPSVKLAVWRRDQGKCVQCKSKEKLEYDHIIPVSKGGSNTERNVQLLCEKCNREKAAKIA